MQMNLMEIAQKLIDELLVEEQNNRQRAEGVAMLFHKIQEAHVAMQQSASEKITSTVEESNVEG
jgi:DNA helicase TIP49 (TBP-interacting protein)